MSSGNNLNFPFEKLRGRENFEIWQRHAKSYLVLKGCWKITNVGLPENPSEKDIELNERALAEITLMLEPINFAQIASATTAKEAWESIISAYEDSGLTRKVDLLKNLVHMKLENFASTQEYVNEIILMALRVKTAGLNIDDEIIASLMLAGLPNEYQPLVLAVENSVKKLTVDNVKQLLLQDSKLDNNTETVGALQIHNAYKQQNTKRNTRKNFHCYNCGKQGHTNRTCRNKPTKYMQNNNAVTKNNNSQALLVSLLTNNKSNEWYVDSGATSHMTNDRKLLIDEQASTKEVIVASGDTLQVKSKGQIKLQLNTTHQQFDATVKNVEYVPNLCANLLSVRQMRKNNNTVVFKKDSCKIYNAKNELIGEANVQNNLYKLNCDSNISEKALITLSNHELWHRRLGHICDENLKLVKKASIE